MKPHEAVINERIANLLKQADIEHYVLVGIANLVVDNEGTHGHVVTILHSAEKNQQVASHIRGNLLNETIAFAMRKKTGGNPFIFMGGY